MSLPRPTSIEPLTVSPDDPLANEHAAVAALVNVYQAWCANRSYNDALDLKKLPGGDVVLGGNAENSRRHAMAAVAQLHHWEKLGKRIQSENEHSTGQNTAWSEVWQQRWHTENILRALMRRNLPFDHDDLLAICRWCCDSYSLSNQSVPINAIVRSIQRYAAEKPLDAELRALLKQLAVQLRNAYDKEAQRAGTAVEQLAADGEPAAEPAKEVAQLPPPQPAMAGTPFVLDSLKRTLEMLPSQPLPATTALEPDRFPLPDESPLHQEHQLLSRYYSELRGTRQNLQVIRKTLPSARHLLELKPASFGKVLLAAGERYFYALQPVSNAFDNWEVRNVVLVTTTQFFEHDFELDRAGIFDLLLFLVVLPKHHREDVTQATAKLLTAVTAEAARSPLTEGERYVLSLYRASIIQGPLLGTPTDEVKLLNTLIQDGAGFFLVPGEAWSDTVNADLTQSSPKATAAWIAMLRHALTATTTRPSAKWLKTATELIKTIGEAKFSEALLKWLPLVARGQTLRKFAGYFGDMRGSSDTIHEENACCLRGLLWCIPTLKQRDKLAHAVTQVALSAYKKVPGVGPRAVKVGNSAIYVLSSLGTKEAVGQLAMLKVRVKFGTAQKEIEKAFDAAATALALPRDQIEELGVPSYGLEEVGKLSETFGTYRAELHVTGSDAALNWFDEKGKQIKSVPAKVKSEHKEELKELQQSLKDIQAMLPAQRDRIDGLFLLQKSWPIAEWRDRYHDHPLVGTIARRLIWSVDGTPAFFIEGQPTDMAGQPIEHGKTAEITLWHPVERTIDEITGWRRRLEELRITQPFKQAYREVYLLTDAERNTRTYSNRYAAHIIRQHQFNALCAARGWKNALRLMVDNSYNPPTKTLPLWGLRAEFWIEGIGDNYGTDTNDTGTYLRLATDQVRFYRLQAAENYAHAGGGRYGSTAAGPGDANINEPLPLDQVPAIVFSEIMRDVDLFVGVASVGNDPTWQDGGPEGRYLNYWQSYSFGELSGTASTRKQVLERLVPRLKIAKRCSFSDRFLVVRGDIRTYKIHLGSGNILMEPNDQYLCIVPDARSRATQDDLYLPFEGDATLSIIISKAFLLAEDTKIKDQTITRQIGIAK